MLEDIMNIVVVGHVDHGKSTVIGRLLADTDALPKGKLDAIRENCRRNSKPFEYAFLLDALKNEQAQGITIDTGPLLFQDGKAPLYHHRRAGPHRVSEKHGHRRFPRRGGPDGDRRLPRRGGKHPPPRLLSCPCWASGRWLCW